MTRKRTTIIMGGVLGVMAAALVLAGLLYGLDGPARAQLDPMTFLRIDMGDIDACTQVSPGDTFYVDVVLSPIPIFGSAPWTDDIKAFEYDLNFPQAQVKVVGHQHATSGTNLIVRAPGSGPIVDSSDGVDDTTTPHVVDVSDSGTGHEGSGESPPDYSGGVLGRYEFRVLPSAPAGFYGLSLSNIGVYDSAANLVYDTPGNSIDDDGDTSVDEDPLYDNTHWIPPYGWIAVDMPCETPVVTTIAVDMDPYNTPGNDEDTVASIESCVQVSGTPGTTFDVDVVMDGVPNYGTGSARVNDFAEFKYNLNFPDTQVKVADHTHETAPPNLIDRAPGSSPSDWDGDAVPDTISPHVVDVYDHYAYEGSGESPPNYSGGVLGRYEFEVVAGASPGLYSLTVMDSTGYLRGPSVHDHTFMGWFETYDHPGSGFDDDDDGQTDEDILLDGNSSPAYGLLAIAPTTCPTAGPEADLQKVDLFVRPFYCGDSDMDGDEATGARVPPGYGTCCDNADNDGNTQTDGQDPKCHPYGNEDGAPWGVDDDQDGSVDEDPGLYPNGQSCPWNGNDDCDDPLDVDVKNGQDDDGDGLIDEDPANGFLGIDNDRDGFVDEDGAGRFDLNGDTNPDLETPQRAGWDDDGDTRIDEDPLDSTVWTEELSGHEPHYLVKEELINNGPEPLVVAEDITEIDAPAYKADAQEDGRNTCNDGLDNETPPDGLIDGQDPDCLTTHVWAEDVGLSSCNDGLDNGGDGYVDELDIDDCQTASEVSVECKNPTDIISVKEGVDWYLKPPSNDPILLAIPGCAQYFDPAHSNKCVPCKIPKGVGPIQIPCMTVTQPAPWQPGYCVAADSEPGVTKELDLHQLVELPVGELVRREHQFDLACEEQTSLHRFTIQNQLNPPLDVEDPDLNNNQLEMDMLVACIAFADGGVRNLVVPDPDSPPGEPNIWNVDVSTSYIQPVSVEAYNNSTAPLHSGVWLTEISPGLGILDRDEDNDTLVDEDGPPWGTDNDGDGSEGGAGIGTCADDLDNNADGRVDCADPTCAPKCDEDPGGMLDTDTDGWADNVEKTLWSNQNDPGSVPENLSAWSSSCYDGVDNDGGAFPGIDFADPKCHDSDQDGHSDAAETFWGSNPAPPAGNTSSPEIMQLPWTCGDGLDNDGDGSCDAGGCGEPPDEMPPEGDDDGNTFGDCTYQQLGGVRPPVTCASGWAPYDGNGDTRPDGAEGGGILLRGDGRLWVTLTTGANPPAGGSTTVTRNLVFHCFAPTPAYPTETVEARFVVVPEHVLDLNSETDVVSGTFSGEASCASEADARIESWDFTPEVPDPFYEDQEHIYGTTKTIHNIGPDPADIRVRKTLNVPVNCDGSLEVNYSGETVVIPAGAKYNVDLGHETEDWDTGPATLTPGDGQIVYVQALTDPLRQLENELFAHFILPAGSVPVSVDVSVDENFDIYCSQPGIAGVDDDGDTVVDEDAPDGLDNDGDTLIDEDPAGYAFQFGNEITPIPYPDVCDPTLGDQSWDVTKVVDVLPVAPEADKWVMGMGPDISASDRDTSDPDLDIWTSENPRFTVTSMDGNLGPDPTDSVVTFLANVPPNCEGRWVVTLGDTMHDYEWYDPADPLSQIHGAPHGGANVPGDGDPMFPPMRSAESALHFQTWEDRYQAYFYNRDFELHCLTDGVHTFTFCNKVEPEPPTVDPNLANNWLCQDLTVTSADCSPTVDSDGDTFKDNIECYLPTDQSDNCRDGAGDDAWPLDVNMDTVVNVVGDVLRYSGRIGATGGPPPSANWRQRLDLNMDNAITVVGDVLKFSGKIGQSCT